MVTNQKPASNRLTTILNKVADQKIYGSVEVYFEAGQITQITQRIIDKVTTDNSPKTPKAKAYESRIRTTRK